MREIFNFNFEWTFHDGDIDNYNYNSIGATEYKDPQWTKAGNNAVSKIGYDATKFEKIDLPHDFVVRRGEFSKDAPARQGCLKKGVAWYRKVFFIAASDEGKYISIEFDGIYRNCQVFLNGFFLKRVTSGYQSFDVVLDDVLIYGGLNVIAVFVDATEYEGWWYEGGGIYRNTRLIKTPMTNFKKWGNYITTTVNKNTASVNIESTINNLLDESTNLTYEVLIQKKDGEVVSKKSNEIQIDANSSIVNNISLDVTNPIKWSIDSPYLYDAITILKKDQTIIDKVKTTFGIRTIYFDTEKGFSLNGEFVKLKGVCCHEDHACIGVANLDEVNRYRILKLKEMGVNAYRSSHNPPTPSLLEACDELGMVVMDETRLPGTTDEQLDELETLILRDRNHPSIVMWSLGNEEMNIQGTEFGVRIFKKMQKLTKKLDPTRMTTYAMNGTWADYIDFNESKDFRLDVQSLNYCMLRDFEAYDRLHKKSPHLALCGSENASTLTTRGLYEKEDYVDNLNLYGKFKKVTCFTSKKRNNFVSGYGEVYPIWGSTPEETWKSVAYRDFVAGIFLWTGFDYRGETTPYNYPAVVSNFGIMDICGFPKDTYYYYQAAFREDIDVLHLFPTWDFKNKDGEDIEVVVHTNLDRIELFLNDKLLANKKIKRDDSFSMLVPFEPGKLLVKGYRGGELVKEATQITPKDPHHVLLTTSKENLNANNEDVMIINCQLVDINNNPVSHDDQHITFEIEGPYRLIGVGNGHPASHEKDYTNHRNTFHGLCQLMIASTFESGDISITSKSDNLESKKITFKSIETDIKPYIPYANKEKENEIIAKTRKDIENALKSIGKKRNEKNEVL
jgi:beta-galactosidase